MYDLQVFRELSVKKEGVCLHLKSHLTQITCGEFIDTFVDFISQGFQNFQYSGTI